MLASDLVARDRQRLRAEAEAAVGELPLPYALEAVAKRLGVSDGLLVVWIRDGFLREVSRPNRSYDLCLPDGRVIPFVGEETFTPDRLWRTPLQPSRRIGLPAGRSVIGEG